MISGGKKFHGPKGDLYFCMRLFGASTEQQTQTHTHILNTSRLNYGNECLKSNQR